MTDFKRIIELIKKTKDKVIIALEEDFFVVMDIVDYENLLRDQDRAAGKTQRLENENQTESIIKEIADDPLLEAIPGFEEEIEGEGDNSGPISVSELIASKSRELGGGFNSLEPASNKDDGDEYFFEEIDD
ncbi:MAG: hypothetical protein AUJ28_03545 [Parcubacteria group bacterium CG1_02_37_51]|uniref:Uncharacterized protein n=2 Tax=Candidatus Komeiliibacteriota TaxID=1817908 RepID=A0A2M8DRY1_9BACT|nr:MAG: hypothetical protein AUJ28_03545 [Parcubacteria group bacterium CG1_02_37_51]PIY94834.1 MAG: hypothetical protein COY67_02055 [Candidatus Komeilibacteria bacterium CG_4_10_14_0_8_um_filter_37_78]PJC02142.1 MAG: hypothetical protein CO073_01025 [Candidatus Komeilibacteria bacterium CG_4_9_14_0_8_um_filter_36_9]